MSDNDLTLKEEAFVEELIKGNSQRQAYLIAYPHRKKWKEKTIDEKASRLFSQSKIKTRFNELKQKLIDSSAQKTIMDAKEILELYTRIARGEEEEEVFVNAGGFKGAVKKKKKASLKDRLKAIERLDRILNLEKNNENDNNNKDDGLTKQIEKIANSDIWEGLEDDTVVK